MLRAWSSVSKALFCVVGAGVDTFCMIVSLSLVQLFVVRFVEVGDVLVVAASFAALDFCLSMEALTLNCNEKKTDRLRQTTSNVAMMP